MTHDELVAAATRELLVDIWGGNEKRADAMMQRLRKTHARLPPDEQPGAVLYHALQLAAVLIRK